jgi:hypothetical protein
VCVRLLHHSKKCKNGMRNMVLTDCTSTGTIPTVGLLQTEFGSEEGGLLQYVPFYCRFFKCYVAGYLIRAQAMRLLMRCLKAFASLRKTYLLVQYNNFKIVLVFERRRQLN